MALFQQSSITVQGAKQIVADSANASADSTMLTRAARALDMATERWNNYNLWHFLLVTNTDTVVVAPITVTGCTVTNGSATVSTTSNPSTLGVLVDDLVSLVGFPANATVTATATNSFGVSVVAAGLTTSPLASQTATTYRADYSLPSDFGHMYDAQLLSSQTTLMPAEQRLYTRIDPTQPAGTPTHYSLFTQGGSSKLRLLPPPESRDVLRLRYHRRMTLPSALATASALDIPNDFEMGLIALAKYYFLLDKGGPPERIQGWQMEGERVLREARGKENMASDGNFAFQPDVFPSMPTNPNDVRPYLDW